MIIGTTNPQIDFLHKKVLLIGPSPISQPDCNLFSEFDYVARMNMFLETDHSKEQKTDILLLNSKSSRFYSKSSKLKDKIVFTKTKKDRNLVSKNSLYSYDMSEAFIYLSSKTKPFVPYMGTISILHLANKFSQVLVSGFDFYINGFNPVKSYISGYNCERKPVEEEIHSIKKDFIILNDIIKNKNNILFDEKTNALFIKNRRKYGIC